MMKCKDKHFVKRDLKEAAVRSYTFLAGNTFYTDFVIVGNVAIHVCVCVCVCVCVFVCVCV